MNHAEVISCVRRLRRLVITLDSIGFPLQELLQSTELSRLVAKKLPENLLNVSSDIHLLVQNIEKSKQYKDAIRTLCDVKVRDENG